MCTGRVDLAFILRAFSNGADGVFIGGCWPGECHYITEGNYVALSTVHIARRLLGLIGANPDRVRLEWISASEGARFAEVMNGFSKTLRELGTIGSGDEAGGDELRTKLEALQTLVPYIKLVERERLRVPVRSVEEVNAFFESEDADRLFQECIVDKFEICRMMSLLREKPRSTGEISKMLGVSPSEISRYLNQSARQGLVTFDENRNLIAAA